MLRIKCACFTATDLRISMAFVSRVFLNLQRDRETFSIKLYSYLKFEPSSGITMNSLQLARIRR
jgi:hypothetical protein